MAETLRSRLTRSWNAFTNNEKDDELDFVSRGTGMSSSYGVRPGRSRLNITNERSIVSSIYNRLGIDAAAITMQHVRLDENQRYEGTIDSGLNRCLNLEANIDQAGRAFRQDIFMTLFDKGVIAIVPVETDLSPLETGGYDIKNLRVGEVVEWFPRHVKVSLWNDITGKREEVTLPKKVVSIIENPLYSVMNEPNSTLQRLIRKLNLLDAVDEASSSGKLDLIIQLPYVIKSEARRQQAEQRAKDIEVQLKGSQYGIAYTDGTERITQLNRPAENHLLKQIDYLTSMLYGQLGLTEDVFSGKADEATMLNYYNRTIEPILASVSEGMKRTFLTQTARSQGQSIEIFRDPFRLVPVSQLAEIADKFTRNEILSSNEVRSFIGMRPSGDPKAEELRNKNIPEALPPEGEGEGPPPGEGAPPTNQPSYFEQQMLELNQKEGDSRNGS